MAKANSIRDIARHAGVSVASVSNVLNGKLEKVSADTAQRIRDLVKELDYQPNMTARTLSSGKSRLIGLVFPVTIVDEKFITLIGENPFYGEFFDGVETILSPAGYDVIISGLRPDQDCSEWVRRRGLDGVIFLGSYSRPMLEKLESEGIAVILTDTDPELGNTFYSIGVDDALGARLAVECLVALGHRRIALAGSATENSYVNRRRRAGYLEALVAAGLEVDASLMFEDNVSFGGGGRVTEKLLNLDVRPTAVFAFADSMAMGIISAMGSAGFQVPRDLSVVGFDDLAIFRQIHPGLTTVRQDVMGKGSLAAQQLLRRLGGETGMEKQVTLPLSLVVRGSTAEARGT